MYKRNAQGWSKHIDFLLIDEISLQLAFILAVFLRLQFFAYTSVFYQNLGVMMALVDALVIVANNTMHNVFSRGYYRELTETFKHSFFVFAIVTILLFAMKYGDLFSRIIVFLTFIFHVIIGYGMRVLWKLLLKRRHKEKTKNLSMLVVVEPDKAEALLQKLTDKANGNYNIVGVVLTESTKAAEIAGYPVVAKLEDTADYICKKWIDSVYIDVSLQDERIIRLMDDCSLMAVPTHYHVPNMSRNGVKRFSEKVGGTTVLTTSINYVTPLQMAMKRLFDIIAGLVGSLLALLVIAIIGPIIKKQSPGPILFKQERIGQNGKRFYMYKIRSMHLDAEERKADLLEQNRVKDGMMFKLKFDPRIIGNEIMPDGTKKTGIGEFIRKTSLDEFPQFFCVLRGTMSTVGTRPPTIDEYLKYQYHHRARLAIKPGITGMWQVSGRSEITDFEEVVRLDTEYITNWSMGLDLKILFKTLAVPFTGKGAM
ncbi:sugar transferase [Ruminococcus sp.]|uniref:sugar transferase n=1 Tax=Ruminococcus sp. TaxID=41978 RepID=UPI0038907BFD